MTPTAAASVAQSIRSMAARHDLDTFDGRNAFGLALRQLRGRDSLDDLTAVAHSLGVEAPGSTRMALLRQIERAMPRTSDPATEVRCPYCPTRFFSSEDSLDHQRAEHEDKCRELGERIARAGRRHRAAERGEDWQAVS